MQPSRNVMFVLYDLPTETALEKKIATRFRKSLLQHGYICFQKSVYIKLLKSHASVAREMSLLNNNAPQNGSVNALAITLSEFQELQSISGEAFNMALFSDDFLVI